MRTTCLLIALIFCLVFAACHRKHIPPFASDLKMSDPYSDRQLAAGFYHLEQGKWRWVAHRFAVLLRPPPGSETTGATLQLQLFIPASQIKILGPVTLNADVGETSLTPQKFSKGGSFIYRRRIPPTLIGSNLFPIVFRFNKALAPSQTDSRELAAVVSEISLEPVSPVVNNIQASMRGPK